MGVATKAIEALREEISDSLPNNEACFINALKAGNSDEVFLIQMR